MDGVFVEHPRFLCTSPSLLKAANFKGKKIAPGILVVVIKCIPQELGFRFSLTEGDRAAVWVPTCLPPYGGQVLSPCKATDLC